MPRWRHLQAVSGFGGIARRRAPTAPPPGAVADRETKE